MPRPLTTGLGLVLVLPLVATAAPSGAAPAAAADPAHTITVIGTGVSTFPAYDADIDRFAVRTSTGSTGSVTLTAATTDPDGRIAVNGRPAGSGAPVTLDGLGSGDEVNVRITDAGGVSSQSFVYLPAGFPSITSTSEGAGPSAAGQVFVGLGSFLSETSFQAVLDEHGVPSYVRATDEPHDFKPQPAGPAYTVFEPVKESAEDAEYGYRVLELDERFQPTGERRLAPVPAEGIVPDDTDFHDVAYAADGRVVMVGYHRDFREGGPWLDAVIQITDPSGEPEFTWTSKGHVDPAEAYVYGAKGQDYAHINSVQLQPDDDVIASFRNLGQVLRIATTAHDGYQPGDVVWRLGGERNEFTFVDDPYGGFCAQHDARILPNGHLMVFDNGSRLDGSGPVAPQTADMCPDPADPDGDRIARPQTRVVEYALDEEARTVTRVWSHEVPGRYAAFAGNAQRLDTGHTLVGWSSSENLAGPVPAPFVTEVDAAGETVWSLTAEGWFSYRAFKGAAPDRIRPTVDLAVPLDGAVFDEGEPVVADFGCADRGGANLDTCTGSVAPGAALDTSPGRHAFAVAASDGNGNVRSRTVHYRVRPAWQPDARIRKPGRQWRESVGFDVGRAGVRRVAEIRVENNGLDADRFTLTGSAGSAAFRIAYRHAGEDVTKRLLDGDLRTPVLEPGDGYRLRITMVRTARADQGDRRRARLEAVSRADHTRRDLVAAVIRAR